MKKEGAEYLKKPDPAKSKIMKIFLPKLEKMIVEEQNADLKRVLKQQFTFFKLEVARDLGEVEEVFKIMDENMNDFEFSENIECLADYAANNEIWANHESKLYHDFFNILTFQLKDTTIANYNMQRRFVVEVFKRTDKKEFLKSLKVLEEQKVATIDSMIHAFAKMESSHFILRYLKALTQYLQKFLVENKDKFRSKNYLLLSLDVMRAIIISVGEEAENALKAIVTELVATFVGYYKETLTLVDELQHLCTGVAYFRNIIRSEIDKVKSTVKEPAVQSSLTFQSLCLEIGAIDLADEKSDEACLAWVNRFLQEFQKIEDILYKDVKKIEVEKGDRVLNDSYLFAAIEILRLLQDRQKDKQLQFKYRFAIFVLTEFARRSPHNFDIMLREVENNTNLCFFEENYEIFLKHDLKGNQYDTLSYLFYKGVNNIPLINLAQKFNEKALDFYRECEKESIESFKSCCKHSNLRVLWEFYTYERLNANSIHRIVVDHLLAESAFCQLSKKAAAGANEAAITNAEYLLETNRKKLYQESYKLAFNCDLVQIQFPKWITSKVFNFDLIGPVKDIDYLRCLVSTDRLLLMSALGKLSSEASLDGLNNLKTSVEQIKFETLRSFDNYHVFRRVNNPLTHLNEHSHMYGENFLFKLVRAGKLGLEVVIEYLITVLVFSKEEPSLYNELGSNLDGSKLDLAKQQITHALDKILIPGNQAMDCEHHGEAFLLLHRLRLIAISFSMYGNDLKTNSKRIVKEKSEAEKESIRVLLAKYTELKDFIKEKEKVFEAIINAHGEQPVIKAGSEPLPQTLKLPEVIKTALPRLVDNYNSRFRHSFIDSQMRLSSIAKSLN
jgi:hypothetical protein